MNCHKIFLLTTNRKGNNKKHRSKQTKRLQRNSGWKWTGYCLPRCLWDTSLWVSWCSQGRITVKGKLTPPIIATVLTLALDWVLRQAEEEFSLLAWGDASAAFSYGLTRMSERAGLSTHLEMAGKSLLRNDTLVPWSCSQHCGENLYQGPHWDTKDNSTGLALHLWTSRALRKTLYRGPKSRPDGLGMLLIQKIWTRRPRLQGLDVWMWFLRSLVQCFPQGPRSSQREGREKEREERVRKKKTVIDRQWHTSTIPTFGKQRQGDNWVRGQSVLQSETLLKDGREGRYVKKIDFN